VRFDCTASVADLSDIFALRDFDLGGLKCLALFFTGVSRESRENIPLPFREGLGEGSSTVRIQVAPPLTPPRNTEEGDFKAYTYRVSLLTLLPPVRSHKKEIK
jgi:hypothetical protein